MPSSYTETMIDQNSEAITRFRVRGLLGVLIALSIPAFLAPRVGLEMAALTPQVDAANPYFLWFHPGLLYALMPLGI